jgi:hypothetical protein
MLERVIGPAAHGGVADSLNRVKRAAEERVKRMGTATEPARKVE